MSKPNILDGVKKRLEEDEEKGGGVIGWLFDKTELDEKLIGLAKDWIADNRGHLIDQVELAIIAAVDWAHAELEERSEHLAKSEVDEGLLLLVKERITKLSNLIEAVIAKREQA